MEETKMNLKTKLECSICPAKIWDGEKKLKKTAEYNEIDVKLDNGSKMTIGVCSEHIKPKKAELKKMEEKNRLGWQEEVDLGIGNEAWVKEGLKLQIVGIA